MTVTFPPLKAWVEEVAGPGHEIHVLMAAGTDPHHFQLKPRDMVTVSRSEVFISFGTPEEEDLEKKLGPALKKAVRIHVRPSGERLDCHYWHNPQVMKACVSALGGLEKWSEQGSGERVERLTQQLDDLDREIAEKLLPYRGRRFYVMHPAFGFLETYGLKQVAIEEGHQSVSPSVLVKVLKMMKADGAGMILMRQGHNLEMRKKIRELGQVELVDVEMLSEDYPALLRQITDAIVSDMKQRDE